MEVREIDETIHEGDQTSAASCPHNQGVYFPVEVFTRQHDGTSKFFINIANIDWHYQP